MQEKDSWDLLMDKIEIQMDLFFKKARKSTEIVCTNTDKFGFKNAIKMEIDKYIKYKGE